jgi:hypothetical protein
MRLNDEGSPVPIRTLSTIPAQRRTLPLVVFEYRRATEKHTLWEHPRSRPLAREMQA